MPTRPYAPAVAGALEGITRHTVLALASSLGLRASVDRMDRVDLWRADEVFLTGTGAGIVPVRSLDGRDIGTGEPGAVCEKLRLAFFEHARAHGVPFGS